MDEKERNLYYQIFKAKEIDVRTFADVMRKEMVKGAPKTPKGVNAGAFSEVVDGSPQKVQAPKFSKQTSGLVQIEHGWHQEDYIWHIGTSNPRRDWKVSQDRLVYAIAATLDTVVPRTIRINIYPPVADWEVKEYTIKAMDLQSAWNVPQSSISALTEKMFKVLNALV